MRISPEQESSITEFGLKVYDQLDYTHGRKHAERTVKLAEYIAEKESADELVCRLGALLHQYHPERADEVSDFLSSLDLEKELIGLIIHCVECVEPDTISDATTPEARIVFDADKLQTLGSFGLVREVCYRTNRDDIGFEEAVYQAQELQELVYPLIQTITGRKLADELQSQMEDVFYLFKKWHSLDFIE